MDLPAEITEYLSGERRALAKDMLIASITRDASHNPMWSRAEWSEWDKAIEAAITRGLMCKDNGGLLRPAPPKIQEPESTQLELF
jgi:hypothetical protein